MSIAINPASIMVYKICRQYEAIGTTIYDWDELYKFVNKTLKYATEIAGEDYWVAPSSELNENIKLRLSRICDIKHADSIIVLNLEKYEQSGKLWASHKIGALNYALLKGCVKTLKEDLRESGITSQELIDRVR